MGRQIVLSFVVAFSALAGSSWAQPQPTPEIGPPSKVQTTSEANRENLQGAVAAPLRDLNVVRTKIPPVLLDAMADPYKRPATKRCVELAILLEPLNDALGADLDAPSVDQDDLLQKGREGAYGVVATLTSGALPFRGWVRKLSGAEQHDRQVQAAITAGAVRRAYLKGLGESRGCSPPATPSHQLTQARAAARPAAANNTPPPSGGLFKPRYPVRQPSSQ